MAIMFSGFPASFLPLFYWDARRRCIYTPIPIEKILDQFLQYFIDKAEFEIVYHSLNPVAFEQIYEDNKITVSSFPLKHRVPTCGFLF
jgi:ribonuclease Z